MNRTFITICLLLITSFTFSQHLSLKDQIESTIKSKNATVGVGIIYNGKDTITINNNKKYPMLSVFKFPLTMAVLNYMDKKNIPLDTKILVTKDDLQPNTYSPLRDKYPDGNINVTLRELLQYTVSLSDNNTCDILINYIGGTKVAEEYVKSLGIHEIAIVATENDMHKAFVNQYKNWITPLEATRLIEVFLNNDLYKNKEYKDFLENTLIETTTGANKLKYHIPEDIIIGHKTGSSDRSPEGLKCAENDMGFVQLPNGKQYTIAVFVKDSKEDDATNAEIIARISRLTFEHFMMQGL